MNPKRGDLRISRAVLVLDLDDTLYLERDYVGSGIAAVAQWLEGTTGVAGFGQVAQGLFATGIRGDLFDRSLDALGIPAGAPLVAEMVKVYRRHRPSISLLPDAEALLARSAEWRGVALLTDGWLPAQQAKIEALGLAGRLDPIVCTDQWGPAYWKPHCRGFELIERSFGPGPAGFVYIADNPAKDFVAPNAMGWCTVQVQRDGQIYARNTTDSLARADLVIASLDQLSDQSLADLLMVQSAKVRVR